MLARNKHRIYLAFYIRHTSEANPDPFHDGIIITPKGDSKFKDTMRFHATNHKTVMVGGVAAIPWQFEAITIEKRTFKLKALLLLGKLSPQVPVSRIEEILSEVPIVQGDPGWKCHAWTIQAIDKLVEYKIIPGLPISASTIVQNGTAFASSVDLLYEEAVPTCNFYGQAIESEVTEPPKGYVGS
ncbi:hypothetical protein BS47DRAFT_1380531 [Hydnum rufescens UP504]|uniref:Uncharacterized protein n=1 Tax=Hydnum rufescens UP504 TaxID=1448309 RepID=A0A9P6B4C7_9AGAM|nr:hypothetical protein BS47DRAFT_1380531 [Hydnum rufescens UP504]